MPVLVRCPCGKQLRLKEELAGKRVRCPACDRVLTVPATEEILAAEPVEEELAEVLPADATPSPAAARPVTSFRLWRHYSFNSFLPLTILLTLTAPLTLVIALAVRSEDQQYAREGVPAEATLLSKMRYRTKGGWTNTVNYRYTAADGQQLEGSGTIPDGPWATLEEGSKLPVKYLASSPSQSKPAYVREEERELMSKILLGVGIGALVLCPLGLLISLRGIARRVTLVRRGTRTVAQITEVMKRYGVLVYRYRDGAGQEHEGRMKKPGGKRVYRPGDTLVVVYDPAKPQRHEVDVLGVRGTD